MPSPLCLPGSWAAAGSPGARVSLSVWLCCQKVAYPFSSTWESDQAYDAVPGTKWQEGTNLHLDTSQVKQQLVRCLDTGVYLRTQQD